MVPNMPSGTVRGSEDNKCSEEQKRSSHEQNRTLMNSIEECKKNTEAAAVKADEKAPESEAKSDRQRGDEALDLSWASWDPFPAALPDALPDFP